MSDLLYQAGKPPLPLAARRVSVRCWGFGGCAVLLSGGAAFCFLYAMAIGMMSSGWVGLRKHEADLATAQRWAAYWLLASVCCWGASSIAGAFATLIYEEAPPLPRFIARLILAAMISLVLAVLIVWGSASIIGAFHRS